MPVLEIDMVDRLEGVAVLFVFTHFLMDLAVLKRLCKSSILIGQPILWLD